MTEKRRIDFSDPEIAPDLSTGERSYWTRHIALEGRTISVGYTCDGGEKDLILIVFTRDLSDDRESCLKFSLSIDAAIALRELMYELPDIAKEAKAKANEKVPAND